MTLLAGLVLLAAVAWQLVSNDDAVDQRESGAGQERRVQDANIAGSATASVTATAGQPRRLAAAERPKQARADMIGDLEYRLLPDNALGMDAAREVLESARFERIASAISHHYAADADVVQARALYARKLQTHLSRAGSKLTTFECGLGYCLGETDGSLGAGGDAGLADGIDAGAFASLALERVGDKPRHRFIFATDPTVRELQGVLGER